MRKNTENLKLTIEDIDSHEEFKNLSPEQKLELISFVYRLAIVLYHSYSAGDE